ncbi:hypothetical protein JCM10450v2_007680 [Rhodotorula kratochvilovae]
MRAALAVASFASLATLAAAQTIPSGYGRFPCSVVASDGSISGDASLCADGALSAPGTNTGNEEGTQGDGVNPTGAECVLERESGAYFCGIAGAACSSDANCDNGHCVNSQCQGGFAQSCSQDDANCLGYLYCLSSSYEPTASNTCGGIGAFCNDYASAPLDLSADEAEAIFNSFCESGYCNFASASCDVRKQLGESCAEDPDYACAAGLTCSTTDRVCVDATSAPSQRARSRRSLAHHKRGSLCPSGLSACAVDGAVRVGRAKRAFECVDTMSALEQCGACAGQGGVDCGAIPGVAAVGCVQGVCEIWACEDGFSFNADAGACVSA